MQHTDTTERGLLPSLLFLVAILFSLLSLLFFTPRTALASVQVPMASCPSVGDVTEQSLLVVLLDRSGSLTYQPGATDPNGYSTSVTKAMADLWPGLMAVIPFSSDNTPVEGPFPMSNSSQRDTLKNYVQGYAIGGDTPLAPALHKALDLLKSSAPGSRAVIVTDGIPDPEVLNGVNQNNDIHTMIPQFCSSGKPISTFGLTIAAGSPEDQLLSAVANGTNGEHKNVGNSHELADAVMPLFAKWQHLSFFKATPSGDNYPIPIDTYAKKVAFVSFRTDSNYNIVVSGPDQQPLSNQVLQRSTDRHYEIDNMVLSSISQPGAYTVRASGDSGALVYALVQTRLHAKLLQPTAQTTAYIGKPLNISAQLFNDNTPIIPQPDEATMNAHVVVQSNGQTSYTTDVELTLDQASGAFSHSISLPGPTGDVTVTINAVYHQIPVEAAEAEVTIPLKAAPIVVRPKPMPVVPVCNVSCVVQRYGALIGGIIGALLLALLLLLFLLNRKKPFGSLRQGRTLEPLSNISRNPVIRSQQLESYGFNFNGASFVLDFSRGNCVVKTNSDAHTIIVKQGSHAEQVTRVHSVMLSNKDSLIVNGGTPATFLDEDDLSS